MVLTHCQCAKGSENFDASDIAALCKEFERSTSVIAPYSIPLKPSEPGKQKTQCVRVSCEWCKKRFKNVHGLAQHCKALHAHLETPTIESNAGAPVEAAKSVGVEQHSNLLPFSWDVEAVKGVEVQQHLTIPPFSYPGQSSVIHLDALSNNHVHDSSTSAPTGHICTHCNTEFADNFALCEHLLGLSAHPGKASKHRKKAKHQRKRAAEAAADSEAQDNAKKPVQVQDQLKCSKCNKKFKVLSALVQHLEHGRCKSANERAVEKNLLGITSQFSRALTL